MTDRIASDVPVQQGDRIDALDVIRGLAVLGILVANITAFGHNAMAYYWPPALPGGATDADGWLWLAQFILIDGKMRGLFALLFGVGVALFVDRAGGGEHALALQARRLGWLAVLGAAHFILLFSGDILLMYASAGLAVLAAIALRVEPRGLLILGIIWAVVAALFDTGRYLTLVLLETQAGAADVPPAGWPAIQSATQGYLATTAAEARVYAEGSWLDIVRQRAGELPGDFSQGVVLNMFETVPVMLIGLGLYRCGLFTDAALRRRWRPAAWTGVALGLAFLAAIGLWTMRADFPLYQTQFVFFSLAMFGNLPLLLGGMLLLTDWAATARASWLGERLAQAGRMAFSNYVGTSLVMSLVFQGWAGGLFGTLHRAELLPVVVLGWTLMLAFSRFWLARFRYGPLEWLWRCLTYWQRFPIRR